MDAEVPVLPIYDCTDKVYCVRMTGDVWNCAVVFLFTSIIDKYRIVNDISSSNKNCYNRFKE